GTCSPTPVGAVQLKGTALSPADTFTPVTGSGVCRFSPSVIAQTCGMGEMSTPGGATSMHKLLTSIWPIGQLAEPALFGLSCGPDGMLTLRYGEVALVPWTNDVKSMLRAVSCWQVPLVRLSWLSQLGPTKICSWPDANDCG